MKSRIDKVKDFYNLIEVQSENYDRGSLLFLIQRSMHDHMLKSVAEGNISEMTNVFDVGMKLQKSNMPQASFERDDKIYMDILDNDIAMKKELSNKLDIMFNKYDFLNQHLDQSVVEKTYQAIETEVPSVLSILISKRILKDQNYVQGIHGLPGSGKSMAAQRIAINTTKLTGATFTLDDIIYDKEQYLARIEAREKGGTLRGSVMILDEGGGIMDAQKWWDKEVQGATQVLREMRFQNTCLLVVSPLYADIVKKVRGIFHALMVPWKDLRKRSLEVDDRDNINRNSNMSFWKFDILDVDPITGTTYQKGMDVAYGKMRKLGTLKPPADMCQAYEKKSEAYKRQRQRLQYEETMQRNMKRGLGMDVEKCAKEIISEGIEKYRGHRGSYNIYKIQNRFNCGVDMAKRIRTKMQTLLEKNEIHKTK